MPVTSSTPLPGVGGVGIDRALGGPGDRRERGLQPPCGEALDKDFPSVVILTGGEIFPVDTLSRLTNMLKMNTQSVLLGEIVLGNEPRIRLYADIPLPSSRAAIAILKDKLAFLLDSRFHPSDPTAAIEADELWSEPKKVA